MLNNLVIPPAARYEYERRKAEWGEGGPAFNINHVLHVDERANIVLNHTNNVPANAMEEQKRRTFT